MWHLDYKESWALKNWCFRAVVLEKTLESPLDCKEIQPVHPKGNQSWIFFGRTDAEAETPILWPLDAKNWLTGKDPDAGKDWRQEEKGTIEDETVGWHHWLNGHDGHESEQALGVGDGQGGLLCCSPWGGKESDTTERLNWTELNSFNSRNSPGSKYVWSSFKHVKTDSGKPWIWTKFIAVAEIGSVQRPCAFCEIMVFYLRRYHICDYKTTAVQRRKRLWTVFIYRLWCHVYHNNIAGRSISKCLLVIPQKTIEFIPSTIILSQLHLSDEVFPC